MADQKISELTAKTTPVAADLLALVDTEVAPDETKKVTWANLFKGPTITTPVIASLYQVGGGGLISVPASAGADTVCLIGATQVLTNKTLTAPVINGIVTTTGLTLPAFTLGGEVDANDQNITNVQGLRGRSISGALIIQGLRDFANTGNAIALQTLKANDAVQDRLVFTGGVNTAIATWAAVTHTGLVLSGALDAAGQFISWTTSLDSAIVADTVSLSGYEIGAGARSLAISQENPAVNAAAGASDWYLPIRVNGVTFKLLLHS